MHNTLKYNQIRSICGGGVNRYISDSCIIKIE